MPRGSHFRGSGLEVRSHPANPELNVSQPKYGSDLVWRAAGEQAQALRTLVSSAERTGMRTKAKVHDHAKDLAQFLVHWGSDRLSVE